MACLGDTDVFLIVELPDNISATALALAAGATGVVSVRTTALLTPEDVDQAAKQSISYTPPGG